MYDKPVNALLSNSPLLKSYVFHHHTYRSSQTCALYFIGIGRGYTNIEMTRTQSPTVYLLLGGFPPVKE